MECQETESNRTEYKGMKCKEMGKQRDTILRKGWKTIDAVGRTSVLRNEEQRDNKQIN